MGNEKANAPETGQRLTSADLVEVSLLVEGRQISSESGVFDGNSPLSLTIGFPSTNDQAKVEKSSPASAIAR